MNLVALESCIVRQLALRGWTQIDVHAKPVGPAVGVDAIVDGRVVQVTVGTMAADGPAPRMSGPKSRDRAAVEACTIAEGITLLARRQSITTGATPA